ncbi:MAG TPA: hypothetical protein VN455_03440, partial [Methanotrichaceae archaeon]|nr:hypothetical protein [Methanotrichaceae archaeon]
MRRTTIDSGRNTNQLGVSGPEPSAFVENTHISRLEVGQKYDGLSTKDLACPSCEPAKASRHYCWLIGFEILMAL